MLIEKNHLKIKKNLFSCSILFLISLKHVTKNAYRRIVIHFQSHVILFRFVESKDSDRVYLFSTNIPRKYSKGNPVNCLVKWNTSKWIPEQTVFIKHTLSALNARCVHKSLNTLA